MAAAAVVVVAVAVAAAMAMAAVAVVLGSGRKCLVYAMVGGIAFMKISPVNW